MLIKKIQKLITKKIGLKKKTKVVRVASQKTKKIKVVAKKGKTVKSKKKTIKKIPITVKKNKVVRKTAKKEVKLKKIENNPIISPSSYSWNSKATFNPTAFKHNGKIHIVYRAVGDDDSSSLGYAKSSDGICIEENPTYCIYKRNFNCNQSLPKIDYLSGGGWSGGCEDPRVVLIDDTVYMIFTAFDGWGSVRLALTSINVNDFEDKKWSRWKKAALISPPGEINKNWVLFPEKINGKFAILHSFYPKILIDYFDNLDVFDGKKFIKSNNTRPVDQTRGWDSWFRGVGPAPLKTKDGWLILYHAMDHRNPDRYRLGAMLLDLKDPTKILYRSQSPILEPEEDYENNGFKWGVVYSCGAVIKDKELFVYYGGSDKYVCAAHITLSELIENLKNDKNIKLRNTEKIIS